MTVVTNRSGNITLDQIYYDWTRGKNFILIKHQQPVADTYDLETNSGATYYYNPGQKACFKIAMPVGILRPVNHIL